MENELKIFKAIAAFSVGLLLSIGSISIFQAGVDHAKSQQPAPATAECNCPIP